MPFCSETVRRPEVMLAESVLTLVFSDEVFWAATLRKPPEIRPLPVTLPLATSRKMSPTLAPERVLIGPVTTRLPPTMLLAGSSTSVILTLPPFVVTPSLPICRPSKTVAELRANSSSSKIVSDSLAPVMLATSVVTDVLSVDEF